MKFAFEKLNYVSLFIPAATEFYVNEKKFSQKENSCLAKLLIKNYKVSGVSEGKKMMIQINIKFSRGLRKNMK